MSTDQPKWIVCTKADYDRRIQYYPEGAKTKDGDHFILEYPGMEPEVEYMIGVRRGNEVFPTYPFGHEKTLAKLMETIEHLKQKRPEKEWVPLTRTIPAWQVLGTQPEYAVGIRYAATGELIPSEVYPTRISPEMPTRLVNQLRGSRPNSDWVVLAKDRPDMPWRTLFSNIPPASPNVMALDIPCPYCQVPATSKCITGNGRSTSIHEIRRVEARREWYACQGVKV